MLISKYLKANKKISNKLDFYFGNERIHFNKNIKLQRLLNYIKRVSEDMIKSFAVKNIKFFSFCYNYYSLAYEKI